MRFCNAQELFINGDRRKNLTDFFYNRAGNILKHRYFLFTGSVKEVLISYVFSALSVLG